ncbi:hypothetical protein [Goodfellowiella coeruleoviolacea]|uniref:hypothetical protein n=1 Tax=Goodfellowiella coeruleoviolacea TaxID=334858 RepID=UPI0020A41851|nr:hypothetical protein [Goodfellowiella coeruleoviolacea]
MNTSSAAGQVDVGRFRRQTASVLFRRTPKTPSPGTSRPGPKWTRHRALVAGAAVLGSPLTTAVVDQVD